VERLISNTPFQSYTQGLTNLQKKSGLLALQVHSKKAQLTKGILFSHLEISQSRFTRKGV